MEPISLRPSVDWKNLTISGAALVLAIMLAWRQPDTNAIAWIVALIAFPIFAVFLMRPFRYRLVLDDDGFTVKSFRDTAYFEWVFCSPFQKCKGSDRVHFDYRFWSEPRMRALRLNRTGDSLSRETLHVWMMLHRCLPVGFDVPQSTLVFMMNDRRKAALARISTRT